MFNIALDWKTGRALFEDADVDKSGTISFEELKAELEKHPGVIENLTIRYFYQLRIMSRWPGILISLFDV